MAHKASLTIAELEEAQERAERFARENSRLQLAYELIAKLGETSGLENTARSIARLVGNTIGGASVFVYYATADNTFVCVNALGHSRGMAEFDDDMVRETFATHRFSEQERDSRDAKMPMAEHAKAFTWAAPLVVGDEILGVLKVEDTTMSAHDAEEQFGAFLSYAALALKNETLNYPQLSEAFDELHATNDHLTKEISRRKKAEKGLREAKRTLETEVKERTHALKMLSEVNQTLVHASDESRLLQDVCETAVSVGGYRLAWVGLVEHDAAKSIRPVAWAGVDADYLENIEVSWGSGPKGQGPGGRSVREGKPAVARDILHDPQFEPWREEAVERGYESSISLPLLDADARIFGAIAVYSDKPDAFDAGEIDLLSELAGDLGFGIAAIRGRAAQAQAEAQAREAARYTRTVIEASIDPITVIGVDGKITDVNQAAEQILGVTRDRLIGRDFAAPFTDPELARAGFRKVLQEGSARNFPLTVRSASGDTIDVLVSATVYLDAGGEVQGILTVARDVTERIEAQAQVARLAAIVTSSEDAILTIDLDGTVTSWNTAAEALYGYSAEEMIGTSMVILAPPGRVDEPRRLIEQTLEGQRVSGYETQRRRKDGSLLDISLTLSPIRTDEGDIVAISSIAHDITERRQAEAERAARLRFAESVDRVNRAIQGAENLEQMMRDVLDLTLELFDCDRAYLLYPCDPESPTWTVPMERTRPEYPGLEVLGIAMPMDPEVAQTLRILLDADGPVPFGPGSEHPMPEDVSEQFGFKSFLSIALYPKVGAAWEFGLHQCRYARVWTADEANLLQEVGRRLEDALTSLLTHRELQESEAEYRRIVDTSGEGILVLGPGSMTTFVNAKMTEMLGYSEAEMIGRPLTDFMFEEDVPDHLQRMEKRRQGLPENYERRFQRKDGETVWTQASATPIFDDEQRFAGSMGMFTDITERRRAEEELRTERGLFVAGPTVVFRWKAEEGWPVEYVSPNVTDQFGYPPEELTSGRILYEAIVHPDDLERVVDEVTAYGAQGVASFDQTYRIEHADGRYRWVDDHTTVIRRQDGAITHYLGYVQDVSERMQSEAIVQARLRLVGFANTHTVPELLQATLDETEALTGSDIGFYHFLDADQRTLTLQAWSTNTIKNMCTAEGAGSHYSIDEAGVWVDCVRERRTVIHNDYASLPHRKGTPEGHAPVVRELVTPVFRGGNIVAILGVGNKAVDYDDNDAGAVTLLADVAWEIAERKVAEEAVRQSEVEYRTLLQKIEAAVLVHGADTRILTCNSMAQDILGLSEDQLLGKSAVDPAWHFTREDGSVMPPDEYPVAKVVSTRAAVANYIVGVHRPRKRAEADIWALVNADPVFDARGDLAQVIVTFIDITERKVMEHDLVAREQEYRTLVESIPDLIVRYDSDLRRTYVNPAWEQASGLAAYEVVDVPWVQTLNAMDWYAERIKRVFETGVRDDMEFTWDNAVGRTLYLHYTLVPERDESGRVASVLAVGHDLTESKVAEEALRATERKLALHLQQTLLGVIEWDTEFRVKEWNPAAESIFGYSRDEVVGHSVIDVTIPSDKRAEMKPFFEGLLRREGGEFNTNENATKDGRVITCEWVNTPLTNDSGKVTGVMSLARDITERKQAEEFRIAKQAAEAASVAKSAFLANMSHEIRTPMNAILGFSQLMRHDKGLSERQRQQLDIINSSGEHLLALVNDVLEMSKIEAGRISANPSAFDLHSLLDEMESLFGLRAQTKGLAFRMIRSARLPRFVITDENKLRQVLVNVLGNAVKFTGEGDVELRVATRRGKEDKLRLTVEVQDTGRGIAPDDIRRLFQYFEQATVGREAETGTGLGLAISREFVRLLGGEIEVESELGVGSTFRFEIVIEPAEAEAVESGPEESRVVGLAPGQPRYRVLVADDAPDNRELLVQLLEQVGFLVRAASDGKEALAVFEEWHPQLVLMDMRMPVIDGYEATRRIRSAPGGADVGIIGVTASAFAEMRQGVFDAGVDEFVLKPFKEGELFDKIAALLGVRYVYEAQAHKGEPEAALDLDRAAMARLPEDLLQRIKGAAVSADFDAFVDLTDEVARHDESAAAALRTLAERFDAEDILSALPGGGDQ